MSRLSKNMFSALKNRTEAGVYNIAGSGAPISGTGIYLSSGQGGGVVTAPTGQGICGPGSTYVNTDNGVVYFNEGTAAAPYWTPIDLWQKYILGWGSDFRDGLGKAIADTAATATLAGSGLRVFGTGIEEVDSGLVPAIGEDGPIATLTASATSGKVAALGVGITTSVPFQPDTHGPLAVEALFAVGTALTSRKVFLGFLGTAADALASPSTGATTVITMVQDDMAGILMDSGLTAATELFAPHNKSDEAASIATTATGVDLGVVMPAFGTYTRLRVEISAGGAMTLFKDKAQIGQIIAALDVDEEVAPVLCITALASATKELLIKRYASWGYRRSGNF